MDEFKGLVLAIVESLIQQHLAGSPFESSMLGYTAMLTVNRKYRSWEEPGSFNHHLSALVYCSQLWIFRLACEPIDGQREGQDHLDGTDDGLDGELDRLMRAYFSNTVSKPVGYLLLWRRRLFALAPVTMVNRPATWDLAKTTVTYRGESLSMDDVRKLCRHTIDEAKRLLQKDLMFGIGSGMMIRPKDLAENDSERTNGWWFGHHGQNSTLLQGREAVLIEHMAESPGTRRVYLEEGAGGLSWRGSGIKLYRRTVQEFLEHLAVAIHISAGPPTSNMPIPRYVTLDSVR